MAAEECELNVAVRSSDTLAYKRRGDRCEGRYVERLSGAAIAVVSFTRTFQDYDLRAGDDLTVTWAMPQDSATHLRGRSLEPKVYYQMDTIRPAGDTMFRWPVEILTGLNLYRARLGVVGFYRGLVGSAEQGILVPLQISRGTAGTGSAGYELLVRPGVQLHEVYVSLAPLDDDGRAGNYLLDEETLGLGFYPAERTFSVALPELPRPGLYRLTLAAEPVGSGTVLVEDLYFHHRP